MTTQRKILILIIILFIFTLLGLFFAYQSFIADRGASEQRVATNEGGRSALFPRSEIINDRGAEQIQQNGFVPTLRQISSTPTGGGIIFTTDEQTTIRYVERATGHVFETTKDSLDQHRISNTTIPRIQRSVWSPQGDMVIFQYLDENEVLKSFYGNVSKDTGVLDGWFLSNNIADIDIHEDGDIFYVQKNGDGANGFISHIDGTNSTSVFSSVIYDLIPSWIGDSIGVVTKASNNIDGFLHQLRSGVRTKLLSHDGLIVNINPSGTKILFSTSNTNGTRLLVHDRNSKEITKVPFTTLAEKCVWANNSTFFCASPYNNVEGIIPDDWYKGVISFSDDIWVHNTDTETAKLVYDAEVAGKIFDAIHLTVDSEQKMLMFTDKRDLTLWGLSL